MLSSRRELKVRRGGKKRKPRAERGLKARGEKKRKIPDRGLVCSGWDVTRPGFRAVRGAMMQELLTEAFCVCVIENKNKTTTRSALENVSAARPRTNAPACMYLKTGLETDTVTKPPGGKVKH